MLAAAFVLVGFVANDVPIMWLWRPLIISVLTALGVELALSRLVGPLVGTTWAFVAIAAVAGLFLLAGATILALTVFFVIRSRPGREYELISPLTTLFGAVFLAFMIGIGIRGGAFDWTPAGGPAIDLGSARPGPNLHVLLLDTYPRADVLARLGFDNEPFLQALGDRGFEVSHDSLSNYDLTPFSIVSMLSLQHVDELAALQPTTLPSTRSEQQRIMTRALLDPPILSALERIGYRTRLLTGDVVLVSIGGADEVWNAGTATNFELDTLQRTPVAGLLELFDFAIGQHRSHIEEALAAFADVPTSPTFTFAHVVAPHAPFAYRSDGTPAESPPCYPATCHIFDPVPDGIGWTAAEYDRQLVAHIQHLNRLTLAAIDRLIETDPDGVIVVWSDHGVYGPDPLDRFRNLIATRTPGHPRLLGPAPTPINVLPRILNAYLDADLPLRADDLYRTGSPEWLSLDLVEGE